MKNIHGRNPQIAPKKSKSSRIKAIRVTICRDARLVSSGKASVVSKVTASSLYQLLLRCGFDGDGRPPTRHFRASLQGAVKWSMGEGTFRCTTTDAQTVRPYKSLLVGSLHVNCYCVVVLTGTDAQTVRPYRSRLCVSLRRATRLAVLQRTHRPCVPTNRYSLGRYPSGHYTIPNKIGIFVDESFTTDFTNNFITYI